MEDRLARPPHAVPVQCHQNHSTRKPEDDGGDADIRWLPELDRARGRTLRRRPGPGSIPTRGRNVRIRPWRSIHTMVDAEPVVPLRQSPVPLVLPVTRWPLARSAVAWTARLSGPPIGGHPRPSSLEELEQLGRRDDQDAVLLQPGDEVGVVEQILVPGHNRVGGTRHRGLDHNAIVDIAQNRLYADPGHCRPDELQDRTDDAVVDLVSVEPRSSDDVQQLVEEGWRDDRADPPVHHRREPLPWRARWRDQPRDDDVGVNDDAQPVPPGPPSRPRRRRTGPPGRSSRAPLRGRGDAGRMPPGADAIRRRGPPRAEFPWSQAIRRAPHRPDHPENDPGRRQGLRCLPRRRTRTRRPRLSAGLPRELGAMRPRSSRSRWFAVPWPSAVPPPPDRWAARWRAS